MTKFKLSPYGEEVDLDDKNTYRHLPNDINKLDDIMHRHIGFALMYINHYQNPWDIKQEKRIKKLMEEYAHGRKYALMTHDKLWFKRKAFFFKNEIENMC